MLATNGRSFFSVRSFSVPKIFLAIPNMGAPYGQGAQSCVPLKYMLCGDLRTLML